MMLARPLCAALTLSATLVAMTAATAPAALGAAAPAATPAIPTVQQPLADRVRAVLAKTGPGTRWGLVVADEQGREVIAINPDGRFMPASNTKLFTTAAAFWKLPGIDQPDAAGGAAVRLEKLLPSDKLPSVILVGNGDARLSAAPDCIANCLSALADAIAAKARRINMVLGDDSAFADERWPLGMSWNNIPTRSGTGISALTIDNNEASMTVSATADGLPPAIGIPGYFTVTNLARSQTGGATALDWTRMPGTSRVILTGTIRTDAQPQAFTLGIDDPADYAAWTLAQMLKARGVTITGRVTSLHRLPGPQPSLPEAAPRAALAMLSPPPLAADLATINKQSQNLHAELVLRRLGRLTGTGSTADGLKVVYDMLAIAGLKPAQFAFSDGSGMSTYNRIAPRGTVALLRWTQTQPWAAAFRATLPIGGVDGTLARRFKASGLEGRIWAKTGTINASHALAGFLTTRSGKTLTFAVYANDVPDGVAATTIMDEALVLLAEAN